MSLFDEIYNSVVDKAAAIMEKAKAEIQAMMAAEDINASGRTSKSFRVERYGSGIRLVMGGTGERTAPLETLEVGRPGGNVPGGFRTTKAGVRDVSNTFKAILVKWAEEKGIVGFGWGHATMLGRRIAEKGTIRHSRPVEVYSIPVMKAKADIEKMAEVTVTNKIHVELLKGLQNGR